MTLIRKITRMAFIEMTLKSSEYDTSRMTFGVMTLKRMTLRVMPLIGITLM